ncbi:unnamed protein product [Polarella glacialis]|uniref:Saccharopine dehydrogenase NADP binding domain-containing protein n=1 Tax=Polarella glacialis TaxID=89957 RepID=A0A813HYG8_POLGL|nr:unnamed protein product [Polarella glacialis]
MPAKDSTRVFDVVVYGASGFTGFLTAKYLAEVAPGLGINWAIGGRNREKLLGVAERLGNPKDLGVIVADSSDGKALREMTRQCVVVASTVGPYTLYGAELVAACVDTGTNYVDLTGEYNFVRQMIDLHHAKAQAKGINIVHCCGFDCVPVDLGAWMATESLPVPAVSVRALCTKMNGGFSGGSLDSAAEISKFGKSEDNLEKARDPYVLAPNVADSLRVDNRWSDKKSIGYDADFGTLSVPYFMAMIDNRLVRRSLALRSQAVSYDESMSLGALARFVGFAAWHLPSFCGSGRPKAGEGPSESVQRDGSFEFEILAQGAGGEECRVTASGTGDPGYGATCVILAECALCLALDARSEGMPSAGGVLTPSTAMAKPLLRRLQQTGRFAFSKL